MSLPVLATNIPIKAHDWLQMLETARDAIDKIKDSKTFQADLQSIRDNSLSRHGFNQQELHSFEINLKAPTSKDANHINIFNHAVDNIFKAKDHKHSSLAIDSVIKTAEKLPNAHCLKEVLNSLKEVKDLEKIKTYANHLKEMASNSWIYVSIERLKKLLLLVNSAFRKLSTENTNEQDSLDHMSLAAVSMRVAKLLSQRLDNSPVPNRQIPEEKQKIIAPYRAFELLNKAPEKLNTSEREALRHHSDTILNRFIRQHLSIDYRQQEEALDKLINFFKASSVHQTSETTKDDYNSRGSFDITSYDPEQDKYRVGYSYADSDEQDPEKLAHKLIEIAKPWTSQGLNPEDINALIDPNNLDEIIYQVLKCDFVIEAGCSIPGSRDTKFTIRKLALLALYKLHQLTID